MFETDLSTRRDVDRTTGSSPGIGTAGVVLLGCLLLALCSPSVARAAVDDAETPPPGETTAEVLEAAEAADWRPLDLDNTLVLTLPGGRVVIELAPEYAPRHAANIRRLVRQRYFDGLAVVRSQDNYVVQWGDPHADDPERRRGFGEAEESLPAELDRPIEPAEGVEDRPAADEPAESDHPDALPPLAFTPLGDGDVYAPEVGFVRGRPAARDREAGRTWLVHCYGMVGAGRDVAADSGSGAELYAVIGHAPRHLDRNVTLVGRVVDGMEVLSTLHRGRGALGFYEDPERRVPIRSIRLAAELPPEERPRLEVLRTDTDTFRALIDARRWRREEWFLDPVGTVGVCNVPLPVRPGPPGSDGAGGGRK